MLVIRVGVLEDTTNPLEDNTNPSPLLPLTNLCPKNRILRYLQRKIENKSIKICINRIFVVSLRPKLVFWVRKIRFSVS